MTKYVVTGSKVSFGVGFVLGLSEEQIQTRIFQLKKYGKNYQVLAAVEFKKGEIIDIISKNLTKATLEQLELLEDSSKIPAEKSANSKPLKKDEKEDV